MALIQLHPMIESISQSMGDMVFYTRYGRPYVRKRPRPNNPNSPAQRKARVALGEAVRTWQGLDVSAKEEWKKKARAHKRSGYHLFLSVNMPRLRQEFDLLVRPRE